MLKENIAISTNNPFKQYNSRIMSEESKKKKVNVTHLINFKLPPRTKPPSWTPRSKFSSFAPFKKERFVNANYRFVLSSTGNYVNILLDPDTSVEWNDVEQLLIPSTSHLKCPICLTSPPIAPKSSKCGHVFCFHCVLHFLSLDQNVLWLLISRIVKSVQFVLRKFLRVC
jgi:hypothetical protein